MRQCTYIAAEGYSRCDPFSIWNVADLQIRLANAQARITVLEEWLETTRIREKYLIESGGTVPLSFVIKGY